MTNITTYNGVSAEENANRMVALPDGMMPQVGQNMVLGEDLKKARNRGFAFRCATGRGPYRYS
jgi:hypothetical protein